MDFSLTDEQQMLRSGAERFLADHYTAEHRRTTLRRADAFDTASWASFAELGWLAIMVPEDAGGLGAGLVEACLLGEELGRALVVEPVAANAVLAARLLGRASGERRGEWLGALIDGRLRASLAVLEAGRGYDLAAPQTTARRAGKGYRLDGGKLLVADAASAQHFIVSASIEGETGLALFLVPADASGLAQCSYPLIDGRRAADLSLEAVQVDAGALLGPPCDAAAALDAALDQLRVVQVAEALGAMEAAMAITAEHLRNRKQFGVPLASFQALQHRLAEMFVEVQEVRSALYHALAHAEAPPAERNAAVSAAVVVASEAGRIVGGQGIQLHGGVGMTDEYQIGHYFKRLLVLEKSWGDVDFHLDRIARGYC